MSTKQEAFIARLVADRFKSLGANTAGEALASLPLVDMDGRQLSQLIDRLLDMDVDPIDGMPERLKGFRRVGANDSVGMCDACGHPVEVREGFFFGPRETGPRWSVCHAEGKCSTTPAPKPVTVSEGLYTGSDGATIMVYLTKNNRLGGKVWNGSRFEYVKGAITRAGLGHRMTAEEAAAFGHSTGKCVFCSQKLTDGRSTEVGYGPICAENNGLPWGAMAKA